MKNEQDTHKTLSIRSRLANIGRILLGSLEAVGRNDFLINYLKAIAIASLIFSPFVIYALILLINPVNPQYGYVNVISLVLFAMYIPTIAYLFKLYFRKENKENKEEFEPEDAQEIIRKEHG